MARPSPTPAPVEEGPTTETPLSATSEQSVPQPERIPVPPATREAELQVRFRELTTEAMLLDDRGDSQAALERYEQALEMAPGSTYLLGKVARLRLDTGDPEGALEAAREVARSEPDNAEIQMYIAAAYDAIGDATNSEAAYERALELSPDNDQARMNLAREAYERGDYQRAAYWYEKIVELYPDQVSVRHLLGDCYLQMERYDEAIEQFKLVLQELPNRETYRALAEAFEAKGEVIQAEGLYKVLARSRPDDVESRRKVVDLRLKYGSQADVRDALRYIDEILTLRPEDEEALLQRVRVYIKLRQWEDVLLTLEQTSQLHPGSQDTQSLLRQVGIAMLELEDATKALQSFTLLKQATPEDARGDLGMGMALMSLERNRQAEDHFLLALEKNAELVDARLNLVRLYQEREAYELIPGQLDRAIETVRQFAGTKRGEEQLINLHLFKASVLARLERFGESREAVDRVLEIDPENEEATLRKAEFLEREGKHDEMERLLRDYLKRHPDSKNALNFLGYTFAQRGIRLEEAEQLIRKALSFDPEASYIIDSLGWVLYRKGRPQEALPHLERAARLSPDPEVLDHLAEVYQAVGQTEKARQTWLRVQELDPGYEGIQDKLDRL